MTNDLILTSGKKTLLHTGKAIVSQSKNLPKSFSEVAVLLSNMNGKVVFSGVGKSGHIARKLSSTFSSIGAASTFIQPTDANHGDLGMIEKNDIIFLISNSGDSPEFKHLINYANKKRIRTVALCSNEKSFLVKNVTYPIVLNKSEEADPFKIVPTTSTSVFLSVGDAMAIEIMKMKKITIEDFGERHPSGKLGMSLLKIKNIMRIESMVPLVSECDGMKDAVLEISQKGLGVTGVVNRDKELVGVITDGDLRRNFKHILTKNANHVMTNNPKVIDEESLVMDAVAFMNKKRITSMFVVKKNSSIPKGIIHLHDCLRSMGNGY